MCVKDVDECLKSAFMYMCNWDISEGPAAEINLSTEGLGERKKTHKKQNEQPDVSKAIWLSSKEMTTEIKRSGVD